MDGDIKAERVRSMTDVEGIVGSCQFVVDMQRRARADYLMASRQTAYRSRIETGVG